MDNNVLNLLSVLYSTDTGKELSQGHHKRQVAVEEKKQWLKFHHIVTESKLTQNLQDQIVGVLESAEEIARIVLVWQKRRGTVSLLQQK